VTCGAILRSHPQISWQALRAASYKHMRDSHTRFRNTAATMLAAQPLHPTFPDKMAAARNSPRRDHHDRW
jgi:hypothetical protein